MTDKLNGIKGLRLPSTVEELREMYPDDWESILEEIDQDFEAAMAKADARARARAIKKPGLWDEPVIIVKNGTARRF